MPEAPNETPYNLDPEDKVTKVMAYTPDLFSWGDVIVKKALRVSVWLRTQMAPQYISIHRAQVLTVGTINPSQIQTFSELYVPTLHIIAFHIMPPDQEPVDYDEREPNRRMEPITALVGPFRFDGSVRMSTQTNLERFLDVTKEAFIPIYQVEITQPSSPSMGVIRVPMALLRRDAVSFAAHT